MSQRTSSFRLPGEGFLFSQVTSQLSCLVESLNPNALSCDVTAGKDYKKVTAALGRRLWSEWGSIKTWIIFSDPKVIQVATVYSDEKVHGRHRTWAHKHPVVGMVCVGTYGVVGVVGLHKEWKSKLGHKRARDWWFEYSQCMLITDSVLKGGRWRAD